MQQTITEKILSSRQGREVKPGELIISPVDFAFSHDGNRPQPLEVFKHLGGSEVFDASRIAMFMDHAPNAHTVAVSTMHKKMRDFSSEQNITLYPAGRGISHQVVPEEGHALPGRIILGSDSHTCTAGALNLLATGVGSTDLAVAMMIGKAWMKVPETMRFFIDGLLPAGVFSKDLILHLISLVGASGATYRAIEYLGSTISSLSIEARMTMTNMAVEMGAKFGIMEADETTHKWLSSRGFTEYSTYTTDLDAPVAETHYVDASAVEPLVAAPSNPDRIKSVREVAGTPIHQATIGTSTNGQIEDLRVAASVLKGNRLAPGVKLYITPASQRAYLAAQMEGLLDTFLELGAVIGTPGCSGCTGGSGFGVPADDETMITSAPRNFVGRTGNSKAEIYLASPATVAASAINGAIDDPRVYISR